MSDPETPPATWSSERTWQRLDPRMLLVHPVREVIRFLPALVALVVAGSASGGGVGWQALAILVPVALGLARYLTTAYRIADGRVELRTGLLNRRVTSTSLDRVRTVDLTSSLIHRLLGLTTLRIGTGTGGDADRLDLDGLPADGARTLRQELLRESGSRSSATSYEATASRSDPAYGDTVEPPPVIAFETGWLRFAPLTSSGLVIAAAALGGGSQLLATFDAWDDLDPGAWSLAVPLGVAVALGLLVFVLVVVVLAVLGYLVANWRFALYRTGSTWRVSRGLFTTRETSLDEERVAGVSLVEGLGLRPLHGGRLTAIATGLDRSQPTASMLVPPAPLSVSLRAAEAVLGSSEPLTTPLVGHGPAAARRRHIRALGPALVLTAALAALVLDTGAPLVLLLPLALIPAAAFALARDRARSLGHRYVEGRVVTRSGSLVRRRDVLDAEHVIGWNFRATWFQRRAGLTSAIATTAGGRQAVTVPDVPPDLGLALASCTMPEILRQFLRRDPEPGDAPAPGPARPSPSSRPGSGGTGPPTQEPAEPR